MRYLRGGSFASRGTARGRSGSCACDSLAAAQCREVALSVASTKEVSSPSSLYCIVSLFYVIDCKYYSKDSTIQAMMGNVGYGPRQYLCLQYTTL